MKAITVRELKAFLDDFILRNDTDVPVSIYDEGERKYISLVDTTIDGVFELNIQIPEFPLELWSEVDEWLMEQWRTLGIARPGNHNSICQYITDDVEETADPINYNTSDFAIGFRRWMES